MVEKVQYKVNDVVRMKKKHPCGSDTWTILRVGMDFGLKCNGCGHFVMMPRVKFEKMAKAIVTEYIISITSFIVHIYSLS